MTSALTQNRPSSAFWGGKKVLLTGHTGFKGAWMTMLLSSLGAKVYGFALPAERGSLHDLLGLSSLLSDETHAHIAERQAFETFYRRTAPDVTIHMAAQALVLPSYDSPLETMRVNVLGTTTVLDVVRTVGAPQTLIVVTSDKVYENHDTGQPYVETDRLSGKDPYSTSKAAAELMVSCYRFSFFNDPGKSGIRVASARAGNVIGAGDISLHRLIPDVIRSIKNRTPLVLRNPLSVRPWQHVLDPLTGYLLLAEHLSMGALDGKAAAFNFGPGLRDCVSTLQIVKGLSRLWPSLEWSTDSSTSRPHHESTFLHLDSRLAHTQLGWQAKWDVTQALQATVDGYRTLLLSSAVRSFALLNEQIFSHSLTEASGHES